MTEILLAQAAAAAPINWVLIIGTIASALVMILTAVIPLLYRERAKLLEAQAKIRRKDAAIDSVVEVHEDHTARLPPAQAAALKREFSETAKAKGVHDELDAAVKRQKGKGNA